MGTRKLAPLFPPGPSLFRDRDEAGRALADRLEEFAGRRNAIVLGLPRGGVPVAAAIAKTLRIPMDIFLVRKLGAPGREEYAFGAITEGGVRVIHDESVRALGLNWANIGSAVAREIKQLDAQHRSLRGGRPHPNLTGLDVIVVDDGMATGATMEAAVEAIKKLGAKSVTAAVPVGARQTCERLTKTADKVLCLRTPEPFTSVGQWYEDFSATTDADVTAILSGAASAPRAAKAMSAVDIVRQHAHPLTGAANQFDDLVDQLSSARLVLLGEASHGTKEFYAARAEITLKLIERGFSAVAVEADWPDAYRVNRYVRQESPDETAEQALGDFKRFPTWMWRNREVLSFVDRLRELNAVRPSTERAGFYGLDLYSLHTSMAAVLKYLDEADPLSAAEARRRYACFDRYGENAQRYAYAARHRFSETCERQVIAQLTDLQNRAAELANRDGRFSHDAFFYAEQNARLVRNAEEYYRTMLSGEVSSWNLRDQHMADTLGELMTFMAVDAPRPRLVVWAHNSHLGDARATEMSQRGELNVGQLVRERYTDQAALVGFTTHSGWVTAASDWDEPSQQKAVRPSMPGSTERLFHDAGVNDFVLTVRGNDEVGGALSAARLERAIGVIYRPDTERQSHYFFADVSRQFDHVIHFDRTNAVEPIDDGWGRHTADADDTYPSGL